MYIFSFIDVQNLALNNKFHTLNLENDYCPDDPRPNTSSYMDGTNKTTMNSLDSNYFISCHRGR